MHLRVGSRSDVGRVRAQNEDNLYVEPTDSADARARGWMAVVADGVGGRLAGEVASGLAVETTRASFYGDGDGDGDGDGVGESLGGTGERLRSAVVSANSAIYHHAQRSAEQAGMASTITAAVVRDGSFFIAQVGDSRAYLVREGQIRRLTRDHSLVAELVRSGELTAEQARVHPARNQVTRALGANALVEVDLVQGSLQPGDVLILCSDGLHGLADDVEIATTLDDDPQRAADGLVALANDRGGTDNISVIVVQVGPPSAPPAVAERRAPLRRRWIIVWFVAVAAVLVIATALLWSGASRESIGPPPAAVQIAPTVAPVPSTVPTSAALPAVQATQPVPTLAPQPTPLALIQPTPLALAQPTPIALAQPTPAPQATPIATPSAPPQRLAHLRVDRTAYIRAGPQPSARLVGKGQDQTPDGDAVEVLSTVPGPVPEDASLPPEEQEPIWYQIVWPPGSDSRGFVHCSAISLDSAAGPSCAPPR